MDMADLMRELSRLWPNHFGNQELADAWEKQYRAVLKPFMGSTLAAGWQSLMGEWDKAGPPKPADIKKHCRTKASAPGSTGYNMREMTEFLRGTEDQPGRYRELMREFYRNNRPLFDQAKAEGWFLNLVAHIRTAAWSLGQREWLRRRDIPTGPTSVPGIASGPDGEALCVSNADIARWRAYHPNGPDNAVTGNLGDSVTGYLNMVLRLDNEGRAA